MSMPHNFSDDPNSFPGPSKSNNTTVILVAIAIVCGMLMLICGGVIFGVVMTVRQAQQEFQTIAGDAQWDPYTNQAVFQEYSSLVADGRYAEALESLEAGLESNPDNAYLHNNKAWLLATCPDDAVRDGELAIEHATEACELTAWNNFAYVDTLAAAYAESGDFESAVKWQEEAIALAPDGYHSEFRKRLRLFKAGKAYREGVPPYQATQAAPAVEEQADEKQPGEDQPGEDQPDKAKSVEEPSVDAESLEDPVPELGAPP